MEKLYNNIVLPDDFDARPSDPDDVPYLKNRPEVIDVSVGRQLFVDDFLIAATNLSRSFHKAEKFAGNPVLKPETDWERKDASPAAVPISGGVWYDGKERLYKMWYHAGWQCHLCYATSRDGVAWERPSLDLVPGTNIILPYDNSEEVRKSTPERFLLPDTTSFFIDDTCDPAQRYKFYMTNPGGSCIGIIGTSPDGVHWDRIITSTAVGDCSTVFYNPFRRKWVYSIRSGWAGRARNYAECDDLLTGANWRKSARWLAADDRDEPNPYLGFRPQLYKVNAIAYESVMLGFFDIWYGPENDVCSRLGMPKITEIQPMFSRDGYHFSRPRVPLVQASMYEGAWDRGYVKATAGGVVIHGDELWIYYSAFGGDRRYRSADEHKSGLYMNGATGLAKLRRDGFASMDGRGTLETRPLVFRGKTSLRVNASGTVRAAILSAEGDTLATSEPFAGDSTNAVLDFGGFDLAALSGRAVRLRFEVDGSLYAFGLADASGDFGGARAAGAAAL